MTRDAGFTLIELIIVIVLLGILAVTALPRLQDSGGVSEYTYQARLVAALRAMQARAMYDTRANYCFQINFVTGNASAFGPPTLVYTGAAAATCASTIDGSSASDFMKATNAELSEDDVVISSAPSYVRFNALGCADVGAGFCNSTTQIDFQGEVTTSVCIESQGYIHACN